MRTLLVCLLLPGYRTQSWYEDCTMDQAQDRRTSALLYAHRCYVRDVPIPVPAPDNVIPDLIIPSHIVVPRCQGKDRTLSAQCYRSSLQVSVWRVWAPPVCPRRPGWRRTRSRCT